jgi:broad specificity phosphatase PhoE
MEKHGLPAGRVWLVRHGESDWNTRRLAQGQAPGPVLTPEGATQCERAARVLARRPVAVLLSSDLTRAQQSAHIIASALGLATALEPALRERSLGRAEGHSATDLGRSSGVRGGRVEDPDIAPPGGETIRQLYERVTGFVRTLSVPDDTDTVLVTHGGVIRVVLAWAAGSGPQDMAWPPIANGAVISYVLPHERLVGAGLSTTTDH